METRYEWDAEKAKANELKHRVSFETAKEVFDDAHQIPGDTYLIDGEERQQIIGMTRGLVLLLVVFVDRSEPDIEIIRIISARKATAYEQTAYEAQFR